MIKVETINDIRQLPETSVQYSSSDPVQIVDAYRKKYRKTPEKVIHYVSPLGNWQFYSIPMEGGDG